MNKLLYYPDFEVKNKKWLKFALLYFPTLHTIIPDEGDEYLSDLYRKIDESTNLFKRVRPDYQTSWVTSNETIELITDILAYPNKFFPSYSSGRTVREWRDIGSHKYTIFRGKYKHQFEEFCLQEGLAHQTYEGIAMSRDLANIFMTNLATNLEEKDGYSPITQYGKYNYVSLLAKMDWKANRNRNTRIVKFAEDVVELIVPQNIEDIPFENILKIRNSGNYYQNMKSFNHMLEQYYDTAEEDEISKKEFLNTLKRTNMEIAGEVLTLGSGIASFSLGAYLSAHDPSFTALEGAKQAFDLFSLTGAGVSLNNRRIENTDKKKSRRYLAQIRRI